jgi:hypothetical protein
MMLQTSALRFDRDAVAPRGHHAPVHRPRGPVRALVAGDGCRSHAAAGKPPPRAASVDADGVAASGLPARKAPRRQVAFEAPVGWCTSRRATDITAVRTRERRRYRGQSCRCTHDRRRAEHSRNPPFGALCGQPYWRHGGSRCDRVACARAARPFDRSRVVSGRAGHRLGRRLRTPKRAAYCDYVPRGETIEGNVPNPRADFYCWTPNDGFYVDMHATGGVTKGYADRQRGPTAKLIRCLASATAGRRTASAASVAGQD